MRHPLQHPISPTSPRFAPDASLGRVRSSARGALALLAAVALLPGCATFAEYDSDQDFGIGIRGHLPLERVISTEGTLGEATASRLELAGSLHRFSPGPANLVIGSADLVLPLVAIGDGAARLYTGGGVHLGRLSVGDDSDLKAGATLLGGLRFQHRVAAPFFEVRGGIGGYSSLSAMAGLRFFTGGN
jgi:hypothetical protein